MTRKTIAATAIAILLGTQAFAITEVDADGDGMASFDEMLVTLPDLTEETFSLIDTNGDGMVDADEYAAGQEAGMLPAGG